jgi:hypothetical protein
MTITISCVGIKSPEPNSSETRDLVYLHVLYNDTEYKWSVYKSQEIPLSDYMNTCSTRVQTEIDFKEALWENLEPKTKVVLNIEDEEEVVPILKEEIVKPDIPDYYALRRNEYQSIGDQIGALSNPNASPSLAEISEKISAVKAKYPKPPWII